MGRISLILEFFFFFEDDNFVVIDLSYCVFGIEMEDIELKYIIYLLIFFLLGIWMKF